MFRVPSAGPGCEHFMTCSVCLTAPDFMNCGWCSGLCKWEHECLKQWNNDSCAPVITEVDLQPCATDYSCSHQSITLEHKRPHAATAYISAIFCHIFLTIHICSHPGVQNDDSNLIITWGLLCAIHWRVLCRVQILKRTTCKTIRRDAIRKTSRR